MNTTTETTTSTSATESPQKPFTVDDIQRQLFAPNELEQANTLISLIHGLGIDTKYNWDPSTQLPEGYGILVFPLQKRVGTGDGKELKTYGAAVCGVPTLDLLLSSEEGIDYARKAVSNQMATKLANALRTKDDGSVAGNPPFSVAEFIENRRQGDSLKTYTEIATPFVKVLRGKGFKAMTSTLLRQVLSSTEYATAHYPRISQENWVKLLDTMIAYATNEKLDPATLVNWKETRDSVASQEITEFDVELGDLAA